MTYGLFHPVILLPKNTDWENKQQLRYILFHEYVHICHYDTAFKALAAIALCIHWFNPMVWVLYILFNRDIELACDECVIRRFGGRSDYARMLISMEERKNRFDPFCNNFSKNAIEERIESIMKIKKASIITLLLAGIVVVGTAGVFATSESSALADSSNAFYDQSLKDEVTAISDKEDITSNTVISFTATETVLVIETNISETESSDNVTDDNEDDTTGKIKLTIEKVIELSKKGDTLTWGDFEPYDNVDIGSGLYILLYDMEEPYYIIIGGTSMDINPMYVHLVSAQNQEDFIDIRTESVEDFIEK